ncbi:MAG: rRNA maturation RNase YbeY [Acutalibacteraceae bacterium]|nr:rRNA maturation RNase YbeY [Acutalibacteraceae bacterium]
MGKIKVVIDNRQKEVKIPTGIRLLLRRCCTAVLKLENFEPQAEVNIIFVDDKTINEINLQQRDIDAPTDVLSFPLGENGDYPINPENGNMMLGDIVISVERAVKQSLEFDHPLTRELGYLTTHSMLHLLGYDHVNGGLQATIMREKEETVMEQVGQSRDVPLE